ncbi:uncharacterized protein LOC127702959 isoform X9 [Mytilus californianus]|uniref:uncharacterized protein LOC127702959 isoform X9 n=1 Tax=Mytilus californianus TaxID=6549 RepID=UPI0022463E45|nr:uncharacterized protein LOC127702959 isoform X9 [Mytilus californianus]
MLFPGNSRWNKYLAGPSDRSSNEMTVRRSRYSSVPPGYFASTKGHSALRKWSYAPTSRASLYEDTYIPEVIRPRSYYDTSREENEIRRGVNDELIYTSNLMDDTYDLASKSRNRDQILLRDATRALVDTETYASPRSSVTSNRLRATSVVNRPAPLTSRAVSCPPTSRRSNQVVVILNRPAFQGRSRVFYAKSAASAVREQSLPPINFAQKRVLSPMEQLERRVAARRLINTVAGPFLLPKYHPYQSMYQPYISMYRPTYMSRYHATLKDVIPHRYPSGGMPSSLKRKKYRKAALVGNKVEISTPHRRRPKSTYAANKMRELKREEREYEVEAIPTQITTGLKATTVSPLYGGKSHWDEEGKVTKPKNLMSWKYRIESRVPPGDYFFPIKTIGHVRDKLLHVKEQMDRHKQLMDRYLPDEDSQTDVKTKIMNMYVDMEQHNP